MLTSWRIVKTSKVTNAFNGEGARLYGGRWNSPGTAVVYTAQSVSLAALELLVHLQTSELLLAYSSIPASFDQALVRTVDPTTLPTGWNRYPAPVELQELGDRWAANQESVVLHVPSAVVPAESNFLINPRHSDFKMIAIGASTRFEFDPRLT
jgi:RES domain-containing protein